MQNKTLFGVLSLFLIFLFASFIILLEKPSGNLSGVVYNELHQPIVHARVNVESYPRVKNAFTNEKGEFHVDGIPLGKYYVNISAKGYQYYYAKDQVNIAEGVTSSLGEVTLKEKDPYLYVSVWSTVKTPDEKVNLTLSGSKVSEVGLSVYKVDLVSFLNEGKALSDLSSDKFDPSNSPQFKKIKEWNEKIPDADVPEFDLKVPAKIEGAGLYLVHSFASSVDRKRNFMANTLVNKSNLGFVLKKDDQKLVIYANTFDHSQPASNADVKIFFSAGPDQNKEPILTDAQGLAEVGIANLTMEDMQSMLVVASQGDNIAYAYVPQSSSYDEMDSEGMVEGEGDAVEGEGALDPNAKPAKVVKYRTFIYTERPLYRPGQKVYFKGVIRSENSQGQYDLVPVQEIPVHITGPKGDTLAELKIKTNNYGAFWGDFDLDEDADLGYYSVVAQLGSKEFKKDFEVDEYRKPEFKVDITPQQPRYFSGDKVSFQVDVQYYFGAPVQAQLEYTLYKNTFTYHLPGEDSPYDDYYYDAGFGGYGEVVEEGSAQTDANGRALVTAQSTKSDEDQKYILRVVAKDITERTVEREGEVLVTAGDFFFQTHRDQYLAMAGQNFPLTIKTFDYDEKPVSRNYKIVVEREKWDPVIHEYSYENEKTIEGKTDTSGSAKSEINVAKGGYYRLNIEGKDSQGREVAYYDYLWVSGTSKDSEDYGLEKKISIVTDKKKYQPGETAKVLLVGPVKDASVLLTIEGTQLHEYHVEKLDGFSKQIEIPLKKEWIPNIFLAASLIDKKDVYEDNVEITLGTPEKTLNVEIKPNAEVYHPADSIDYKITTKDSAGNPVSADISLGVVDESLYALKEDKTNIQKFFWGARPNRVATSNSFSGIYSGGIAKEDQNLLRRNFKDTAYWNPSIITNDQGEAIVNFKLPDNLTTWRATVLGDTLSTQVGQQINKVISSKDLIARLASPRFFRERDQVTLKAILHNYTNQAQTLTVSLGLEGLDFANPQDNQPRTLTINPKQIASFDFTVLAKIPGKAKVQLLAKNASVSDGVELKIPVLPHGLEEHHYSQGEVSPAVVGGGSKQNVTLNLPAQVDPSRSQLKLTLDTSFVAQLIGSLSYLIDYPYGCVEQTMSRLLPALMVADLNKSMGVSDPVLDKKIERVVKKGIKRILGFQHSDGGWGWWKQDETDPFMTAYALYGLVRAQQYGQKIDADVISRGKEALEKLIPIDNKLQATQGPVHGMLKYNDTLAFIIYVDSLLSGKAKLPPVGDPAFTSVLSQSYLALAAQVKGKAEILQQYTANLERNVVCQNGLCHFSMGDPQHYGDVEATAWALQALIKGGSTNQILKDQIVAWLIAQRKGGMWRQTRETAATLYALAEYARTLPPGAKGVKANVSLNGAELEKINVASPHFVRRFTQAKFNEGNNDLGLENLIDHSLFYQTDLTFFSKQEDLGAVSNGLKVSREYVRLSVLDFTSKTYKVSPLKGPLKPGEIVGVRIVVQNDEDIDYVLIADPLPSGFEVVDGIRFDDKAEYFAEMETHDDLVALFSTYLPKGVHSFDYALRPELQGDFHVMPTQVEEMYRPEVNASGPENKLQVQ